MCHVILCSLWFLQPFLPDVHSEGSPIAQVFWESIGGLPAVAMATEEIMAKAGPFELPNGGKNGTLTWEQKQEILRFTGVSAAVRERKQTKGIRHLTLSGPVAEITTAKKMAMEYVLTSQSAGVVFAETPGSEGDWKATERQPKKRKKQQNSMPKATGCSNSSSTSRNTWNQQPLLGMQWPPWGMMPMMYPPAMPPMSMMCPMQMAACRSEAFDEPSTADFEEKDEEWPSWTDSQVAEFRGTTAKAPGAMPIKIEVKQEVCEHAPVMGKEPPKNTKDLQEERAEAHARQCGRLRERECAGQGVRDHLPEDATHDNDSPRVVRAAPSDNAKWRYQRAAGDSKELHGSTHWWTGEMECRSGLPFEALRMHIW